MLRTNRITGDYAAYCSQTSLDQFVDERARGFSNLFNALPTHVHVVPLSSLRFFLNADSIFKLNNSAVNRNLRIEYVSSNKLKTKITLIQKIVQILKVIKFSNSLIKTNAISMTTMENHIWKLLFRSLTRTKCRSANKNSREAPTIPILMI